MDETLYFHNPDCTKSKAGLALLQLRGIAARVVCYLESPPSLDELMALSTMLGGARAMLRGDEHQAVTLGLSDPEVGDERILAAIHALPVLMQRPIFVHRGRAVIGRPPERVLALL
jgi:arsenate reductase (glutaredoxin)